MLPFVNSTDEVREIVENESGQFDTRFNFGSSADVTPTIEEELNIQTLERKLTGKFTNAMENVFRSFGCNGEF